MLMVGEKQHDEPVCRVDMEAALQHRPPRRESNRGMTLIGLIVSILLLPAPAAAVIQKTKHVQASTPVYAAPADGSADTRVSPYTITNRKHAASRAVRSPAAALSGQPPHNPVGQGQRY